MEYIARNRIELKPGFRSGEGVEFSAKIEPRPGFYQGRKYNKLHVNQCNEKMTDSKITNNIFQDTISENDEEIYYNTSNDKFDDLFNADSISGKVGVSLYPNPAKSQVNIFVSNYSGKIINYYVYDVTGRKKLEKTSCSPNIKINVNGFSPGIYIVEIKIKDKIFQKRFSKLN